MRSLRRPENGRAEESLGITILDGRRRVKGYRQNPSQSFNLKKASFDFKMGVFLSTLICRKLTLF